MSEFDYLSDEEKRKRIAKMRQDAQEQREKHQDGQYMSVKDAIDEYHCAHGTGEKVTAGAKIVGKSLFNIGRFAMAELLPYALEQTAKKAEKSMKK